MPPSSSEPPEAAPPPGQRSGGFCQLVRAVSPLFPMPTFINRSSTLVPKSAPQDLIYPSFAMRASCRRLTLGGLHVSNAEKPPSLGASLLEISLCRRKASRAGQG